MTIAILGVALPLYHVTIAVVRVVSDRHGCPNHRFCRSWPSCCSAARAFPSWRWPGARATGLGAIWRALSNGVSLGDMRLTSASAPVLLVNLLVGMTLMRCVQRLLRVSVMSRTRLDHGA